MSDASKYAGHTPGPWTVNLSTYRPAGQNERKPDAWEVLGANGEPLPTDYSHPEAEGNARLIADAPKLLAERDALLEACKATLREIESPESYWSDEGPLAKQLRAAIALVEGKS